MYQTSVGKEHLAEYLLAYLATRDNARLSVDYLESILSISNEDHSSKVKSSRGFLTWARSNKHVKVVTDDIPINILPVGIKGKLHDVKVFSRGPDDAIYDAHKDIREKVARGNSFLELDGGPHSGTTCIIYALKKFTGGLGDDDDRGRGDAHIWQRYFLKPLHETVKVVALSKANGEAAHLSARKIQGTYILCAGSKNVHMVFRRQADLERYSGSRYLVASQVSQAILDTLDAMEDLERNRLLEFLHLTEFTAVFEILNPHHQHVEDLSHLKKCHLQFICWTSSDLETPAESQLCSMPPHLAIELAKALKLSTVNYEVINYSKVDERMTQIRNGYGYEGEVLYFLDKSDNVIGLLKKKTIWYIVCRAIREKVRASCTSQQKSPATFNITSSIRKLESRLDEIQSWLGISDEATNQWKVLGSKFTKWCHKYLNEGKITVQDVADLFPVQWNKFLAESSETDKIQARYSESQASLSDLPVPNEESQASLSDLPVPNEESQASLSDLPVPNEESHVPALRDISITTE